jgi:Immunity protein Imm1
MEKESYFHIFRGRGWPTPSQLERYFLTPLALQWVRETRSDCWSLNAEGLEGTGQLPRNKRVDLILTMTAHPDHGVLLNYRKFGGGYNDSFFSKRDLSRLREWIETAHGDLNPVGLYIPFESAWKAVKEFMETDGQIPKSIEWVAGDDLPADAFPDPYLRKISSEEHQ